MFINSLNSGFNNHKILQDKRLLLDHSPLYAELQIIQTNIEITRRAIKKDSDEEAKYHLLITSQITNLPNHPISSVPELEELTNQISSIFKEA